MWYTSVKQTTGDTMWRTIGEIPLYEINENKEIRNSRTGKLKKEHRGNSGLVRLYKIGHHSNDPKDHKNEVTRKINKLYYEAFPEKLPGVEIDGYPMYRILDDGRVFGMYEAEFLKFGYNSKGYQQVALRRDNVSTTVSVHRLVAEAYLDAPVNGEKLTVNHIDGDKTNNHISNLEWNTYSENLQHAYNTGLADSKLSKVEASLDGVNWVLFKSFIAACKHFEIKYDHNMYDTARKNTEGVMMNRGTVCTKKPFRTRGVAFRYPKEL